MREALLAVAVVLIAIAVIWPRPHRLTTCPWLDGATATGTTSWSYSTAIFYTVNRDGTRTQAPTYRRNILGIQERVY